VLRSILGPKREGVKEGWRNLHDEELCDLYSSLSIIRMVKSRKMRRVAHVIQTGEKTNVYSLLEGNPDGKRQAGRQRCRWVDNIKIGRDKMEALSGLVRLRIA
jgi:hypothetical protein